MRNFLKTRVLASAFAAGIGAAFAFTALSSQGSQDPSMGAAGRMGGGGMMGDMMDGGGMMKGGGMVEMMNMMAQMASMMEACEKMMRDDA